VLLTLFVVFHIPLFRFSSAFATTRDRAALAAGGFFIGAGLLHFLSPDRYVAMIPPVLPEPLMLVLLSGAAEVACGIGLVFRSTRRHAAWATIAVLFAILPANIYVALSGGVVEDLSTARWYYLVRIPFQLFYVAWVAWSGGLVSALRSRQAKAV